MSDSEEDWDADIGGADEAKPGSVKTTANLSAFADVDEESDSEELDGEVLAATLNRKFGIQQKSSLQLQSDAKKPTLITPEMLSKFLEPAAPAPAIIAPPSPKPPPKESPLPVAKSPKSRLPSEVEAKKLPKLDLAANTELGDGARKKRSSGALSPDSPKDDDADRSSEALVQSLKNIKQVAQKEAKTIPRLEQNILSADNDLRKGKSDVSTLTSDVERLRLETAKSSSTAPTSLNPSIEGKPLGKSFMQILFLAILLVALVSGAFFIYTTKKRQAEENTFEVHSGL